MKIIRFIFLLAFIKVFSQEVKNDFKPLINETIELFNNKQIVALGENHGRKKESEFRIALIKDSRFAKKVDVIVVEFANPLYQNTIDDYVNGKKVPLKELKKVWQNTTQVGGVWDSPIYKDLFDAVREVNLKLLAKNRIRIIAADPPIDWSKVHSFKDFEPFSNRGKYPINVVKKEVYEKNLKALLIFGSNHVELKGRGFTSNLLSEYPNSIAVIMCPAFDEKDNAIIKKFIRKEIPHLINLEVNKLGEINYSLIKPFKCSASGKLKDATHYKLFLGLEKDKVMRVPEHIKNDTLYQKERKRRLKVLSN